VTPPPEAAPARRLAVAGAVLELVAAMLMEQRLGRLLGEPLRQGRAGRLAALSVKATAAGAAVLAFGGRHRIGGVAGGGLLVAGSMLRRLAIFDAGKESARDPKYTVVPQRQRLQARADGRSPTGARATSVAS
jgi:hypothetical protein